MNHDKLDNFPFYVKAQDFPNYVVFKTGRVYSRKRNFMTPTFEKSGYITQKLCANGSTKTLRLHCLVYNSFNNTRFLEASEIDHIDRNKLNNCLYNLREATSSENANNRNPPKPVVHCIEQYLPDGTTLVTTWTSTVEAGKSGYNTTGIRQCCAGKLSYANGYIWRNADRFTDTSEFIPIASHPDYRIRPDATIINKHDTVVQRYWHQGHWQINLDGSNGKRNTLLVKRLLASTFIPNPNNYPEVYLKDQDRSNVCVDNLYWATRAQGVSARCAKAVAQINPNTNEVIQVFRQTKDAYAACGKSASGVISEVCNGKKELAFGYKWTWWEGELPKDVAEVKEALIEEPKVKRRHKKGVVQIDPDTDKVICVYDTIQEAYKAVGKKQNQTIQDVCNGLKTTAHNFKWKWVA